MKTRREIFDQVKTHLLTQNARSVGKSDPFTTTCMYRGPDGKKCAVGCLITDEEYDPSIENITCDTAPVADALKKSGVDTSDRDTMGMLRDLQRVHDDWPPSFWPSRIEFVERRYFGG